MAAGPALDYYAHYFYHSQHNCDKEIIHNIPLIRTRNGHKVQFYKPRCHCQTNLSVGFGDYFLPSSPGLTELQLNSVQGGKNS